VRRKSEREHEVDSPAGIHAAAATIKRRLVVLISIAKIRSVVDADGKRWVR